MEREKRDEYYVRVRLTKDEYNKLENLAKEQRRSKSEIVRIGLENMYDARENNS